MLISEFHVGIIDAVLLHVLKSDIFPSHEKYGDCVGLLDHPKKV